MKINSIFFKYSLRAIPEKPCRGGGGGGDPQTPTTHVFRKVHIPTNYRIKYDNVY